MNENNVSNNEANMNDNDDNWISNDLLKCIENESIPSSSNDLISHPSNQNISEDLFNDT